jgi:hypothetical protein
MTIRALTQDLRLASTKGDIRARCTEDCLERMTGRTLVALAAPF